VQRPGAFTGNAHLTGVPEALVHGLVGPLWIGIEAEHIHNTLYSGFGMGLAGYGRGEHSASPETALQKALAHWRSTRNQVNAPADAVMVALLSSGDDPTSVTALEVMAEHALAEAAEADNAQQILATPAVRDGPPEVLVLTKHPLDHRYGRRS